MRIGVSCFRHRDRERNISPSWEPVPCSVSLYQWQAGSWACETAADVVGFVGGHSSRGMCRALRSTAALAMRWVPSEIYVAEKPSLGLRPFTGDLLHRPAARLRRNVPGTRMVRQPVEPPKITRGIRLSRLHPVVIGDLELNGRV